MERFDMLQLTNIKIACTGRWEEGKKEGNILFNDALNTFYLQLYVTAT